MNWHSVPGQDNLGVGEQLGPPCLDGVELPHGLARIVVVDFDHDAQPLVLVVCPAFGFRAPGVLVQQQNLRYLLPAGGDGVVRGIVGVEHHVEVLDHVEDAMHLLGQREFLDALGQRLKFFEGFRQTGLVLVRELYPPRQKSTANRGGFR